MPEYFSDLYYLPVQPGLDIEIIIRKSKANSYSQIRDRQEKTKYMGIYLLEIGCTAYARIILKKLRWKGENLKIMEENQVRFQIW